MRSLQQKALVSLWSKNLYATECTDPILTNLVHWVLIICFYVNNTFHKKGTPTLFSRLKISMNVITSQNTVIPPKILGSLTSLQRHNSIFNQAKVSH